MNLVLRLVLGLLIYSGAVFPAAAFTSLHIFGDAASTTTNGPGGATYYGRSYSNGRVWVELLAQRQGLNYVSNQNWSFFGHYHFNLVTNSSNYTPPPDVSTALYVVWINNADFVWNINNYATNLVTWTNSMNQSLSNHSLIIQTLYNKGVRTLIMPNVADLGKIPQYASYNAPSKAFIRQRTMEYNTAFAARLQQARTNFANLTIYSADIFALLDDVVAHASNYGLTNALYLGQSVSALDDPTFANKALNGPGTNHIFWDYLDPSAKFHTVIADHVLQAAFPVRLSNIVPAGANQQLVIANTPIGRAGVVESSTNFVNWATAQTFPSTNLTQTVSVPATASQEFYRLRFPFSWTWP
ncbi:MAG: SGNH/GDSL hydrolase family protein [Verrucomicrobiota bacterium]